MKVTNSQIDTLYTFTRQHYVEWYDGQTELVDHLANGIEEQWQENPNLTFDEALKNEFKRFGVLCYYGFYLIKESIKYKKTQKQTGKKWLFENVIVQLGGFIHLLNIGIYMPIINFDRE